MDKDQNRKKLDLVLLATIGCMIRVAGVCLMVAAMVLPIATLPLVPAQAIPLTVLITQPQGLLQPPTVIPALVIIHPHLTHTAPPATGVLLPLLTPLPRLLALCLAQDPSLLHQVNAHQVITGCLTQADGVWLMDKLMCLPVLPQAVPHPQEDITVAASLMILSLKDVKTAPVRVVLIGTVQSVWLAAVLILLTTLLI